MYFLIPVIGYLLFLSMRSTIGEFFEYTLLYSVVFVYLMIASQYFSKSGLLQGDISREMKIATVLERGFKQK